MAIDHIIDYDCIPKQTLTTSGIIERLKGKARAQDIIRLYRMNDDDRPPSEMGFEYTRSTPEGDEEKRLIVVQDLLDQAAELQPLAQHCAGCPANRTGQPFGCASFIQYPISAMAEAWLLDRLPVPDDTLVWLLLKQGVDNFQYDGQSIAALRLRGGDTYFESSKAPERHLGEFSIDANQAFEMMFTVGDIIPNHAAILLLFFHAISRNIEAEAIMSLTPARADAETAHPFTITIYATDDNTVREIKDFLHALYVAWKLNVKLIVDA